MLERKWRLEHEEKVRQAIAKREDERDARAETNHREQMDTLRDQHKWALAVFGGAVIAATVVSAMIEAGWIGKPW